MADVFKQAIRSADTHLHTSTIWASKYLCLPSTVLALRGCQHTDRMCNAILAAIVKSFTIQGIAGHGYFDECVVPVIENTARECELTASLRKAMQQYPKVG